MSKSSLASHLTAIQRLVDQHGACPSNDDALRRAMLQLLPTLASSCRLEGFPHRVPTRSRYGRKTLLEGPTADGSRWEIAGLLWPGLGAGVSAVQPNGLTSPIHCHGDCPVIVHLVLEGEEVEQVYELIDGPQRMVRAAGPLRRTAAGDVASVAPDCIHQCGAVRRTEVLTFYLKKQDAENARPRIDYRLA
ncbi:MAG: hypothetical protein KDD44_06765 [Bdellovibrionales bacterium]|nr:hypothetical protein [Bdellovibrionales bacterium]